MYTTGDRFEQCYSMKNTRAFKTTHSLDIFTTMSSNFTFQSFQTIYCYSWFLLFPSHLNVHCDLSLQSLRRRFIVVFIDHNISSAIAKSVEIKTRNGSRSIISEYTELATLQQNLHMNDKNINKFKLFSFEY